METVCNQFKECQDNINNEVFEVGLLLSLAATTPPALCGLESHCIDVALKSESAFHFLTTNMPLALVRHHITDYLNTISCFFFLYL